MTNVPMCLGACLLPDCEIVLESGGVALDTSNVCLKKNNEKQAIRTVSRQTIVPNTRRDTMSSVWHAGPRLPK
jgi:hypothetical protein